MNVIVKLKLEYLMESAQYTTGYAQFNHKWNVME